MDPQRIDKPMPIDEFIRMDPQSRLIVVGDANMAPYELSYVNGSIYLNQRDSKPSIDRLKFLARTFRHSAWINPVQESEWNYAWTIKAIRQVFPCSS